MTDDGDQHPPDPVAFIADAQRSVRWETARRERRERRGRRVTLALAALLSIAALITSLAAATTRTEELAPQVAERVAERVGGLVVQSARAERVEVGRRKLGEANTQLIARDLPVVADPGDTATGDELIIAAATARVLAILPETTVGRLRDDVRAGRLPAVLPSAVRLEELPLEDTVVTVLPDPTAIAPTRDPASPPPSVSRPSPPGRTPAAPPPRAPAPPPRAPDPAPSSPERRGLLEPCIAGAILC